MESFFNIELNNRKTSLSNYVLSMSYQEDKVIKEKR